MRFMIANDYDDMSRQAADFIYHDLDGNQRKNIAVTAGTTPIKTYEYLTEMIKDNPEWSQIHFYNFDEIPYRDRRKGGITIDSLNRYLYEPAGISSERIHILSESNYQVFDKTIEQDGGIDLCVLGIGSDGHFCSNTPKKTKWGNKTVKLPIYEQDKNRIANLMFHGEVNLVPDFLITMGPRSIMNCRRLLLIASGTQKANAIRDLTVTDTVDEMIPATILKLHPDLTIIADRNAAALASETLL